VAVHEKDGALVLDVIVQPRASRAGVGPLLGDRLRVAVNAAPVDGQANDAVVSLLADAFGVRRGAVSIVRGEASRRKTVRVVGGTTAVWSRLSAR
jgi:uncharacterized protein (TIGR00251 family)